MSMRSRALLLACVAALAATAAGCGDDESSTTSPSSKSGAKPLRVAVLIDETGTNLSGEQRARAVLEAWTKARNDKGGVAGHPVELVIRDTKGEPARATAAATAVAGDSSIVAAISFDANAESIYAKRLVTAGIPVIGGMGFDPRVWGAVPNWYSVTTNFPSVINSALVLAKSVGATKPAYAVCAEVATCAAIGGIAQAASTSLGMSYAGTIKLAAAKPDYTAQCLSIKKSGVDFVALAHGSQVDLRFAKQCGTQGFAGGIGMMSGSIEPELMKQNDPGVKIDLALNAFPWFAPEAPAKAYRDLMRARDVPESSWADPHGTAAYATLELFAKALDAVSLPGTPTRQDVVNAYGTVKNETLGGLLPQPLTFTAGKPATPVSCYWLGEFEHGEFRGAGLVKPTCDPLSLKQTPK
jgi:branched-chain amino acid transport system substrate-binding protein